MATPGGPPRACLSCAELVHTGTLCSEGPADLGALLCVRAVSKRLKTESEVALKDEAMQEPGASPQTAAANDFSAWKVQDLMKLYYSRLFPHQQFSRWMAYGNDSRHPQADSTFFQRREFCFTLDGDIFVRYQSFKDGAELQAAIISRLPAKIDIGPVYNVDPKRRTAYTSGSGSASGFTTVERELVFDIDLTDYDDVRTCGSGGHICNACWPLMAVAVQILDAGLREDFGFEHILWVFSGRRGVHCWVCDERARRLTDEQRSAVASYFAVYKGLEEGLAKLALSANPAHDTPVVQRAFQILESAWVDTILPQQGFLEDEGHRQGILKYLPTDTAGAVQRAWDGMRGRPGEDDINVQRWHRLVQQCAKDAKAQSNKNNAQLRRQLEAAPRRIIMAYTYPRLDMEVSKKMNHLLKAPFCVHPKTGKVCVPIAANKAVNFDPETVPTVGQLLSELNPRTAGQPVDKGEEWRRTALAGAVELFETSFLHGLEAAAKDQLTAKARNAAAKPTFAWQAGLDRHADFVRVCTAVELRGAAVITAGLAVCRHLVSICWTLSSPTSPLPTQAICAVPLLRRRRPWQGNASWGRSRPLRASAVVFDADDYLWTEDDDDDDYSLSTDVLEPLNSVNTDRGDAKSSEQPLDSAVERGKASVVAAASIFASVPQQTVAAVETTWVGASELIKEAVDEGHEQVKETAAKVTEVASRTRAGRAAEQLKKEWEIAAVGLPKDMWGRIMWVWDRPTFKRLRIAFSMANISVRLPAIIALVGTQIGLLATQVSLPMLAPLLLGTGMMFRTIRSNASLIFPRVGLLVVLLWVLWFVNSVVQNTVMYLRRQGAIDHRVSGAVINASEMCSLGGALVIMLSIIGINVSALLIPAGVALALAAKDLSHNFLAGFFLFAVQPFKLGDRVSVSYSASTPGVSSGISGGWFEGVCEKVDLRYTTIKSGRRRLLVPNSAFITREFMILDDAPDNGSVSPRRGAEMAPPSQPQQQVASYPVAPPQPQHQQPVPHDWVQRTLEAEPFHRDSSQPVHMPAGSHQQATPADSNGGCALVISTRHRHGWEWEEQNAGQMGWQGRDAAAFQHEPARGGSGAPYVNGDSGPAPSQDHSGSQRGEPAFHGYRAVSADEHYKGRSPSRPRRESGYGRSSNGSQASYPQHTQQPQNPSTQGRVGQSSHTSWDGRGYDGPNPQLGGYQGRSAAPYGPW